MTDLQEKAMKMALERLESHEYWMDEKAIKALRQALAQPEQEPVAWIHTRCGHPLYLSFQYHAEDVPLYTAPPSIEAAVLAEREACAKVCDDWPNGRDDVCLIAAAIRARSKK